MNTHKHARLTFARRLEMVQHMTLQGLSAVQGVTPSTALPHIKSGQRIPRATTGLPRPAYRPNMPTVVETFPGFKATN
jgi:tripartite-type tricarboxylate transporter receptor subunit TctC